MKKYLYNFIDTYEGDDSDCRALIWEDKHEEDYTTEIEWEEK